MNNDFGTEKIPTFSFPFSKDDCKSEVFKKFSKSPAVVTEVSFPSSRVPTLRINTPEFVLKISRVKSTHKKVYVELGEAIAAVWAHLEVGETSEAVGLKITLNKTSIATVEIIDEPQQVRRLCSNWFKVWEDETFHDFLAMWLLEEIPHERWYKPVVLNEKWMPAPMLVNVIQGFIIAVKPKRNLRTSLTEEQFYRIVKEAEERYTVNYDGRLIKWLLTNFEGSFI